MKIKRFFASDIRQAIKMVRDELGPDAVILSNRAVDGGIEIVSAIDYDESLIFNSVETKKPQKNESTAPKTVQPASFAAAQYAQQPAVNKKANDELSTRLKAIEQSQGMRKADEPQASPLPKRNDVPAVKPVREPHPANKVEWSQEPALVEMRRELKSLRSLLENQLSGFAWGELQRRNPNRVELMQRLQRLGIGVELSKEICKMVSDRGDFSTVWQQAMAILEHRIVTLDDDILSTGGVVALVGPTGVGKTTTVAKLAARYALRHGSRHVALITLDNYRIGAYEQLRAYGRILDVPVRVAEKDGELRSLIEEFYERRLVLIDTAGMSQRDTRVARQFEVLRAANIPIKTHLVLSTTTRLSAMEEIVNVYKGVQLSSCILTKLDETTSLGSAISTVIHHQLPVSYISDGQRVPEDIHMARADGLVQRSVALLNEHERLLEEEQGAYTLGRSTADAHV